MAALLSTASTFSTFSAAFGTQPSVFSTGSQEGTGEYTAEVVDEIVIEFEKACKKGVVNMTSVVKRSAADADLLQFAEKARNTFVQAVQADRNHLRDVFEGTGMQRFHRVRSAMKSVQLSDMYATDARWNDLRDSMDTVEAVLKDLGIWRELSQSQPPENLRYDVGRKRQFLAGDRVKLKPEHDGGDANSFTISPALPEGLKINAIAGKIKGTLTPGVEVPEQTYTVTAMNDLGETAARITFGVKVVKVVEDIGAPATVLASPLGAAGYAFQTGSQAAGPQQLAGGGGGFADAELRALGYEYAPGPIGDPSDLVLRQVGDVSKGFEWRGQENYDSIGEAVLGCVEARLLTLCGLEALPLPPAQADASGHSAVYATPGLAEHTGPLLLLLCGSAPGGAPGVWGRSLCINASLLEGAMFDYILRAKALGWAVLIANPHTKEVCGAPVPGSESPHEHARTLWKAYIRPSACSCVLAVAHSYGGPCMVNLLKCEEDARTRIKALALTDGGAFFGELCQEAIPTLEEIASSPKPGAAEKLRAELEAFAALAPEAFKPPSAEVLACVSAVGRNFVASPEPLGTVVAASRQGFLAVSSGHTSHPSTTHSATEEVFAFLRLGPEGSTAVANAGLPERAPPA